MKCKKLVSLFLSLLLATALAVPPVPRSRTFLPTAPADGMRDGSLFLSGETVRSSAAVNGVLLAAGRTVGVNGTGAYVMAAGYEVTLGGTGGERRVPRGLQHRRERARRSATCSPQVRASR